MLYSVSIVLVSFLLSDALTKYLTKAMWGKEAFVVLADFEGTGVMARKSQWQEHEAVKKSLKQKEMNVASQLRSSFSFSQGLQPTGWHHPQLGWPFISQLI